MAAVVVRVCLRLELQFATHKRYSFNMSNWTTADARKHPQTVSERTSPRADPSTDSPKGSSTWGARKRIAMSTALSRLGSCGPCTHLLRVCTSADRMTDVLFTMNRQQKSRLSNDSGGRCKSTFNSKLRLSRLARTGLAQANWSTKDSGNTGKLHRTQFS